MDPNPNVFLNDNDHIAANVHKVTITLQDVAVQLGLSINGEAVTGLGKVPDPWGTYERLLGRVPQNDEEG
ncbi:hypothetical protein J1N35_015381 [Gossypium stocksii]|uniref:Uncharacterized protein n=1 Tax=Gossypium stocksii TaxID=47602 RepID=A0A9D3VWU0_9ROSI|nr:hypothetical protein J1N35_015381 [Gossypium stocksii]